MERLRRSWSAFKDIAIVFSFLVNFVLIIALLVTGVPGIQTAFALKAGMVEPLLDDLDAAFVGLGESSIDTTIAIDEEIPITFDLPLDEPLDINFPLTIEQDTSVTLNEPVQLNRVSATFNLPGGGGVINGTVSLQLPIGLELPIRLETIVPVTSTIPVRMTIPVSQSVAIQMNVPVHINLGEAGLDPAVQELRAVFEPLRQQLENLPDGVEFGEGQ